MLSGIYDNLSFSAGQFYYRTEGIEPDNRLRRNVENALVQVALSDRASLLAEFRHSRTTSGTNSYLFAPFYLSDTYRQNGEEAQYRIGGRFDITPVITLVGVWTQLKSHIRLN